MRRWQVWVLMICSGGLLSAAALAAPLYEIDLIVDYATGAFVGEMTVSYANPTNVNLSDTFFRVFANDPTIYGDAFVTVSSASVQSSSLPIEWFVDDTVLRISLDSPLSPNEVVEMHISFHGQASMWPSSAVASARTGYGILTKSPSALTLTAFYPVLAVHSSEGWALDSSSGFGDTLMSDAADYVVHVSVQEGVHAVASGTLQSTRRTEAGVTHTFSVDQARDFSLVLFEEGYGVTTDHISDKTINTWFITAHQPAQLAANEMAVASLALYENLVGPCIYNEIDVVEVPLQAAAGVEFSGLILVGTDYGDRPDAAFFAVIISHEMAHQWFYAGVGNDVSECPWLDESFATYLSYVFLNEHVSPSSAQDAWETARNAYANAQDDRDDLRVTSPRYAFPNASLYSAYVYSGGALLLDRLRRDVGDDVFYDGVRTYYREFVHRMATPSDLFAAFEDACACSIRNVLLEFRIVP